MKLGIEMAEKRLGERGRVGGVEAGAGAAEAGEVRGGVR